MIERSPRPFLIAALALLLAGSGLVGCGGKAPATIPEPGATAEPARPAQPQTPPSRTEAEQPVEVESDFPTQPFEEQELSIDEINRQRPLESVRFDYDRHELSDEARFKLRRNAEWLRRNPRFAVVVEGHCDDRGTIEYNLALGQRRASAVREYLVGLGVDNGRLRAVSFGEERPACLGSNEEAWRCNRRAEFRIE